MKINMPVGVILSRLAQEVLMIVQVKNLCCDRAAWGMGAYDAELSRDNGCRVIGVDLKSVCVEAGLFQRAWG